MFISSIRAIFRVITNFSFIDTLAKLAFELVNIARLFTIHLVVSSCAILVTIATLELGNTNVVATLKVSIMVTRMITCTKCRDREKSCVKKKLKLLIC